MNHWLKYGICYIAGSTVLFIYAIVSAIYTMYGKVDGLTLASLIWSTICIPLNYWNAKRWFEFRGK